MTDVTVERTGQTLLVTMNRAEARNALTQGVLDGVLAAIEQASSDDAVRCLVLTGAGGHFCAGADLKKNLADDPELFDHLDRYIDTYQGVIRALVRCKRPSIAMLDGCAVGFGADLALACDLRVATPEAYVQEKFVQIGLMPDGGGTFWLPRLVGTARAMKAILFGEQLGAKELFELGIVMEIAAKGALRETTLAVAKRLEAGPPLALTAIREALYGSLGSIDEALLRERAGQLRLLKTADMVEGVSAWAEKRAPNFKGV
jgi:enoyl-CoA hydratase/carnithine racemase